MQQQLKRDKKLQNSYGQAYKMSMQEKDISFLNNYFIFKKVRNVDTDHIFKLLINNPDDTISIQETKHADKVLGTIEATIDKSQSKVDPKSKTKPESKSKTKPEPKSKSKIKLVIQE